MNRDEGPNNFLISMITYCPFNFKVPHIASDLKRSLQPPTKPLILIRAIYLK